MSRHSYHNADLYSYIYRRAEFVFKVHTVGPMKLYVHALQKLACESL
jgi:hypothetical protein